MKQLTFLLLALVLLSCEKEDINPKDPYNFSERRIEHIVLYDTVSLGTEIYTEYSFEYDSKNRLKAVRNFKTNELLGSFKYDGNNVIENLIYTIEYSNDKMSKTIFKNDIYDLHMYSAVDYSYPSENIVHTIYNRSFDPAYGNKLLFTETLCTYEQSNVAKSTVEAYYVYLDDNTKKITYLSDCKCTYDNTLNYFKSYPFNLLNKINYELYFFDLDLISKNNIITYDYVTNVSTIHGQLVNKQYNVNYKYNILDEYTIEVLRNDIRYLNVTYFD